MEAADNGRRWLVSLPGDVLEGHGVLDIKAVTLALDLCAIDQNARVSCQAGKGHHNVVVQHADLAHRAVLLQLGHRLLFYAQHHAVGTANADLCDKSNSVKFCSERDVFAETGSYRC